MRERLRCRWQPRRRLGLACCQWLLVTVAPFHMQSQSCRVNWVDFDGAEVPYTVLEPGQRAQYSSWWVGCRLLPPAASTPAVLLPLPRCAAPPQRLPSDPRAFTFLVPAGPTTSGLYGSWAPPAACASTALRRWWRMPRRATWPPSQTRPCCPGTSTPTPPFLGSSAARCRPWCCAGSGWARPPAAAAKLVALRRPALPPRLTLAASLLTW